MGKLCDFGGSVAKGQRAAVVKHINHRLTGGDMRLKHFPYISGISEMGWPGMQSLRTETVSI